MTWTVLGESVAGTSHRARGTPCQDAHRWRTFGPAGEWLVVAAADGAGSASHADIGAALACDEFVSRVTDRAADGLSAPAAVMDLFAEVRAELVAEAARREVPTRELACTALLAVVGPDVAAFGQLGDGAIVFGADPDYRTAYWPEPAGYANATDFLTDDGFEDAIKVEIVTGSFGDLAVLTDGLQRLALDFAARGPHPDFFRPMFRSVRDAADVAALRDPFRAFLDSPRVNERTDDDKTLVLATRHVDTPAPR